MWPASYALDRDKLGRGEGVGGRCRLACQSPPPGGKLRAWRAASCPAGVAQLGVHHTARRATRVEQAATIRDAGRSTGLAPFAGTIDRLTGRRGEELFSAGLAPVESTIRLALEVMRSTEGKLGRSEG
ncbi:MAG: hypothetical protein ACREYB_10465, partial [Casimicrobiaceae bacterium]